MRWGCWQQHITLTFACCCKSYSVQMVHAAMSCIPDTCLDTATIYVLQITAKAAWTVQHQLSDRPYWLYSPVTVHSHTS